MSKPTPGPWFADADGDIWRRPIGDLAKSRMSRAARDRECIRRLTAQRAELLEALRSLRATCRQAINSGDWKVDGACDPDMDFMRADAVIAKATGEQP